MINKQFKNVDNLQNNDNFEANGKYLCLPATKRKKNEILYKLCLTFQLVGLNIDNNVL